MLHLLNNTLNIQTPSCIRDLIGPQVPNKALLDPIVSKSRMGGAYFSLKAPQALATWL